MKVLRWSVDGDGERSELLFAPGEILSTSRESDGTIAMTVRTVVTDLETSGMAIGTMKVWTGTSWDMLMPGETVAPIGWKPELDRAVDSENMALLDELHCDTCGFQLSKSPCGPQHAWIMDNPLEHPLLKPLLLNYLHELRRDDKVCGTCSSTGADVKLGSGDCVHIDARDDQVLMSRRSWEALVEELVEYRRRAGKGL